MYAGNATGPRCDRVRNKSGLFHQRGWREGVCDFASAGFGGGEGQDGAEAFAAGEDGISHALVHGLGADGHAWEKLIERIIDEDLLALEISFEIGHGREPNRNFR